MGGKDNNNDNNKKNDDEDFYGLTLMLRDTPENRKIFPEGKTTYGVEKVKPSICPDGVSTDCTYYHYQDDATEEGSLQTPIHMLIASYRDKLCGRTLHNAFRRAKNPSRIYIRIIDQTQPDSDLIDDAGCWETFCHDYNENCDEYKDQVQTVHIDASESKGPTYARSKLSSMIEWDYEHRNQVNEIELQAVSEQDFCMQIDSHMDFSDNYDVGLIDMHHRTKNDYAVLSTYVTAIEENNKDLIVVPNLCMVTFTSSIRNWATKECRRLKKPKLTNAMWGAGLSFHRCHAELNVPVDPYLDGVFDGEEGSRGFRFFTHGYDVYTPDKVLVTHDYHGHQSNPVVHTWGRGKKRGHGGKDEEEEEEEKMRRKFEKEWKWNQKVDEHRPALKVFGSKRVNMLLGIGSYFNDTENSKREVQLIKQSRYGLGTRRTLQQAITFTGINLLEEKMEENKCGNLIWVPYEENINYGIDETLSRPYTNEVAVSDEIANFVALRTNDGDGTTTGKQHKDINNHQRILPNGSKIIYGGAETESPFATDTDNNNNKKNNNNNVAHHDAAGDSAPLEAINKPANIKKQPSRNIAPQKRSINENNVPSPPINNNDNNSNIKNSNLRVEAVSAAAAAASGATPLIPSVGKTTTVAGALSSTTTATTTGTTSPSTLLLLVVIIGLFRLIWLYGHRLHQKDASKKN